MGYLVLGAILGVLVGGLIVYLIIRKQKGGAEGLTLPQMKDRQEHLEKLRQLLRSKNTGERLVNADIEKILDVSDATTTRYFDQMEKEGLIRQEGSGKQTYYTKL